MEKCTTGRFGFHPGGADVRVEYDRATASIVSTSLMFRGVGRSSRGFVWESDLVMDDSNCTKD